MRSLVILIFLTLVLNITAFAGDVENIHKLVNKKIDIVVSLLTNKKIEKKERDEKIIKAISPIIDFRIMAKMSLKKKHKKKLTKLQRKEFYDLFEQRLHASLIEKLDLYTDEQVLVDKAKQINKNLIDVLAYLVSGSGKKTDINFRFIKTPKSKKWKVFDVEILGTSIVTSYRSNFANILTKGSYKDLKDWLLKSNDIIPEKIN